MIIKTPNPDKFDDVLVALAVTGLIVLGGAIFIGMIALNIFLIWLSAWWLILLVPLDIFAVIYCFIKLDA